MIADVFIIVLGILFARFIVHKMGLKVGLTAFAALCVGIQIVHDYLFYLLFTSIPRGSSDMMDHFKDYAKEVGINAIFGDSVLVIFAVVLSALLNTQSYDTNIILLILGVYLAPFVLYIKL